MFPIEDTSASIHCRTSSLGTNANVIFAGIFGVTYKFLAAALYGALDDNAAWVPVSAGDLDDARGVRDLDVARGVRDLDVALSVRDLDVVSRHTRSGGCSPLSGS